MSRISVEKALELIAEQKFSNLEDSVNWVEGFKTNGLIMSYLYVRSNGKQWLYLEQTNPPFEKRTGNLEYVKSIENEILNIPYIYYREKHIKIGDIVHTDELIFFTKSLRELKHSIKQDECFRENEQLVCKVVLKDGQLFDIKNERG